MELLNVKLTEDEILTLDGRANAEAQKLIDSIKELRIGRAEMSDLPAVYADFVSAAVDLAKKNGKLDLSATNLHKCKLCGQGGDYWPHARSSRYHRKGQKNFDNPVLMRGIDLGRGFVYIKNSPTHGCCDECWKKVKPFLIRRLEGVRAEVHEWITGVKPIWKKHDNKKCKCGWTGHEGEMGKLRTLMGDGYYPGKCPKCGAESVLFNNCIETIDGFAVVENTVKVQS